MAPEGGMGVPLLGRHITHVRQGAAGEGEAAAVVGHQALHDCRVVNLALRQPVDGCQHWCGALEATPGHGVNDSRIEKGLVPLHVQHPAFFRPFHPGER